MEVRAPERGRAALYTELLAELYVPVPDSASGGVDPVPGLGMVVLGWILYRQARGVGRDTDGGDLAALVSVRGSGRSAPGLRVF